MALIKHTNGSSTNVRIRKDIITELIKCKESQKEVDEVIISRIIKTNNEKDRGKLKDLCTKYRIDVTPLDRHFLRHKIFIRERTIRSAFIKLIMIKTYFKG